MIANGTMTLDVDKLTEPVYHLFVEAGGTSGIFDMLHNLRDNSDAVYMHSLNVSLISNTLATWMRLSNDEIELATAGGLLHDIGKVFEYTVDLESGLIDYNEEFGKEWITHSQYGFSICMNAGFKRVARMIAAHHARADWGAIIDLNEKDLEPILYLIHHIDDLSAKFGKTNVAMLGG